MLKLGQLDPAYAATRAEVRRLSGGEEGTLSVKVGVVAAGDKTAASSKPEAGIWGSERVCKSTLGVCAP